MRALTFACMAASSVLTLASAASHNNPTGKSLRGLQQLEGTALPLAGASWSLAQDLPLKDEGTKKQEEEHEVIMPRKDSVPTDGDKQEQQGGALPLADASWSLAQDLPLKGEAAKDVTGEGLEVMMPRKDYNTWPWTAGASPALRDAAGGEEEHEVNMPRKEVVFPEGGKQQAGTALPLAGASWSLVQDLPLKEGGKQQGEEPEVIMPRKDAVSSNGEKQEQQGGALPLADASWSLAQDLHLKEEGTKNQEEEHEIIMPRKDFVPSNSEKQQQQNGALPLADASWSLAQDLPLKEDGKQARDPSSKLPAAVVEGGV